MQQKHGRQKPRRAMSRQWSNITNINVKKKQQQRWKII